MILHSRGVFCLVGSGGAGGWSLQIYNFWDVAMKDGVCRSFWFRRPSFERLCRQWLPTTSYAYFCIISCPSSDRKHAHGRSCSSHDVKTEGTYVLWGLSWQAFQSSSRSGSCSGILCSGRTRHLLGFPGASFSDSFQVQLQTLEGNPCVCS